MSKIKNIYLLIGTIFSVESFMIQIEKIVYLFLVVLLFFGIIVRVMVFEVINFKIIMVAETFWVFYKMDVVSSWNVVKLLNF